MYSLMALEFTLLCWFASAAASAHDSAPGGYVLTTIAALYTTTLRCPSSWHWAIRVLECVVATIRTLRRWILPTCLLDSPISWIAVVLSGRGGTRLYRRSEPDTGCPAYRLFSTGCGSFLGPMTSDSQIGGQPSLQASLALAFISTRPLRISGRNAVDAVKWIAG